MECVVIHCMVALLKFNVFHVRLSTHQLCDKVIDLEISAFVPEVSSLDSCLSSLFLLVWEKYCVESNFKLYDKETKLTNSGSLM